VFVTVETILMLFVLPMSVALGALKLKAAPASTLLFALHVITGAVVSTTEIVWLQVALLPHASVARQVRTTL